MSEEASPLSPGEIDDLLRQAQANAGTSGKPASGGEFAPAAFDNPAPAESATPAERISPGDMEFLLDQAQQALQSVDQPAQSEPLPGLAPFKLEEFSGEPPSTEVATLELIRDVELDLKIELGRTQMYLEDVLKLHKGSVVPLDRLAGDPVDIFVNGRLIARGEILVLNDTFCVRVAELITAEAPRS